MKRAGFTMIELIFVIVILGILAAVAIPKLAATRTDAEVSKGASDVATLISDLGSYYTAQGTFAGKKASDLTNVKLSVDIASLADASVIHYGGTAAASSCIKITFNAVADGNITVADGGDTTLATCKGIQAAVTDMKKDHIFGGTGVSY